jgi:hypothetical protein
MRNYVFKGTDDIVNWLSDHDSPWASFVRMVDLLYIKSLRFNKNVRFNIILSLYDIKKRVFGVDMSLAAEVIITPEIFKAKDREVAVGGIKVTNHYCTKIFKSSKALWNYVIKTERRAALEYVLLNGRRKRVFLRIDDDGQWLLQEGDSLVPALIESIPIIISNERFEKAAKQLIDNQQMKAVDRLRLYKEIYRHQIELGVIVR